MSARAEVPTAVVTVNSLSRGNPASQPKPGAVNVNFHYSVQLLSIALHTSAARRPKIRVYRGCRFSLWRRMVGQKEERERKEEEEQEEMERARDRGTSEVSPLRSISSFSFRSRLGFAFAVPGIIALLGMCAQCFPSSARLSTRST